MSIGKLNAAGLRQLISLVEKRTHLLLNWKKSKSLVCRRWRRSVPPSFPALSNGKLPAARQRLAKAAAAPFEGSHPRMLSMKQDLSGLGAKDLPPSSA